MATPCFVAVLAIFGALFFAQQSHQIIVTHLQDCPFGDASQITVNDVKQTCREAAATFGMNALCKIASVACCGTCHIPNNLKDSECPYGDDNQVTIGNETMTCQDAFHRWRKAALCQHPHFKRKCCKSCQKPTSTSADCPYGDDFRVNWHGVLKSCAEVAATTGKNTLCYQMPKACCETCRVPNDLQGCPHGDDARIIWDGVKKTCAEVAASTGKNALCHLAAVPCCGTCHIPDHLKDLECPHGDDNHFGINDELLSCQDAFYKYGKANMCRLPFVNKRCCKSCQIPAGAPLDCLYGDDPIVKINSMPLSCEGAIALFGKSICDNTNVVKECCESCAGYPSLSPSLRFLTQRGSVAELLARRTRDLEVAGSISDNAMLQLPWESNLPELSPVHPPVKWVSSYRLQMYWSAWGISGAALWRHNYAE
ncbi:hypothetical protein ElyMa_003060100 [Elysia marginata]|uniref:ShKT domain-containing protein n=1 Tax=Elysia marginata TaxID=1093978 RepID=A0AAV4IJ26_9GAST|nr:hypothetical protein ElyMa_003060100 [Elysia marginata]